MGGGEERREGGGVVRVRRRGTMKGNNERDRSEGRCAVECKEANHSHNTKRR